MKGEKKLSENLTLLNQISSELGKDTFLALERMKAAILADSVSQAGFEEAAFWIKAAVRCFTNHIDAISYIMRKAVFEMEGEIGLNLSNRTRADLMEWKYNKETDEIVRELSSRGAKENLKLAFRYFPKLFGSEWELDTNNLGWASMVEVLKARNEMTHPTKIEFLYPVGASASIVSAVMWFFYALTELFRECGGKVGLRVDSDSTDLDSAPLLKIKAPKIEPNKDFYEAVEKLGSNSLAYVREIMRLLWSDTSRALGLISSEWGAIPLGNRKGALLPKTKFAGRLAVRVLFSEVEGMAAALRLFIEAAEKRSEIVLSAQEEEFFDHKKDECERLAIAATIFSQYFGYGRTVDTTGKGWRGFQISRQFRNRITHPRNIQDLDVKIGTIQSLVDALEWYGGQFLEAIELDADKWAKLMANLTPEDILPPTKSEEAENAEGMGIT